MCAVFRDGNKQEYPNSKCWHFTALSLDFVALHHTSSNLKILFLSDVKTALLVGNTDVLEESVFSVFIFGSYPASALKINPLAPEFPFKF